MRIVSHKNVTVHTKIFQKVLTVTFFVLQCDYSRDSEVVFVTGAERAIKTMETWERVKGLPTEVLEKLAFAAEFLDLVEKHSGDEKKPA